MLEVFPHPCLLFHLSVIFHLPSSHLFFPYHFPLFPSTHNLPPSFSAASFVDFPCPLFLSFSTDPVLPVPSWPLSPHAMLHSFCISLFIPSLLSHVDFPPAMAVSRDKMTGVSPGTCVTNGNSMLLSCAGR